jgi:hypothetical protein
MTMDSNVIKFPFGVPARLPRAVPEVTPGRGDSLNLRLRIERREPRRRPAIGECD